MHIPISQIACSIILLPLALAKIVPIPAANSQAKNVIVQSYSLTDHTRKDPFAKDGRARSVMVTRFSPVKNCAKRNNYPYMPPKTTAFMDSKFSAAYGLPQGSFQSLRVQSCMAARSNDCTPSPSPLVVFSGALGTSRTLYNVLLQNIAAQGYLVVSIDHPYDADIVEFPDGQVVLGVDIGSDAEVEQAVTTRVSDIAFVVGELKANSHNKSGTSYETNKIAVIGHSLGGAAAASAMQTMPFLSGGVNLDGTMFGPVLSAGFDQPFLLMGHENKTQDTDPSWKALWPRMRGWKREIEVRKAAHYSFSDLPLVVSALGLDGKLPPAASGMLGSISGERMMDLTVTYVTAFLGVVLKSAPAETFARHTQRFPEAQVVGS